MGTNSPNYEHISEEDVKRLEQLNEQIREALEKIDCSPKAKKEFKELEAQRTRLIWIIVYGSPKPPKPEDDKEKA